MSAEPLLLAIDAGTTGVRCIVFDTHAAARGDAYAELSVSCPQPGWVEADPAALWSATRRVIEGALRAAGASAADVIAVGVANQRATTLLWDRATGDPVYPAIVWQDVRTAARVADLQQRGVFASTMASATKIEWLLGSVGGAAEAAERGELCFGTVDSWLIWKLSGGALHLTDHSNASCTGLYDFGMGTWDTAALEMMGISRRLLPEIVASAGSHGRCDPAASSLSAPVAAIAGDQQASMFGLLRHRPGDFKVTLGTSAMVDVNTGPTPVLSRHGAYPLVLWQLGAHRSFCLEGSAATAGAAVQWLRDGLGVIRDAGQTGDIALEVSDSGGVWVVPAFQGLGTPFMDASARATIGGLSRASTRAHVVRAVLEGISFRCRQIIDALVEDTGGAAPSLLRADGGAAENAFLLQHLANALGIRVERPATVQGTALGAALMAGIGIGVWSGPEELGDQWAPGAVFEPAWDAARREAEYAEWRRQFERTRQNP